MSLAAAVVYENWKTDVSDILHDINELLPKNYFLKVVNSSVPYEEKNKHKM